LDTRDKNTGSPVSGEKPKVDMPGLVTGGLLMLIGVVAALQSRQFDSESQMFPLVIASLLAVAGAAIAIHAITKPVAAESLIRKNSSVVLAVFIFAAWAAAFAGGAGFIMPTIAMQASLLWLGGLRRPTQIVGLAILITALAYLLFVVLLEIPLPPSALPGAWQEF
jgi:hypothetical protein